MNLNNTCSCISTSDSFADLSIQLLISIIGAGVGAIVGAYFGLILARKWDRKKREEEREEDKKITINAIYEELKILKKEIIDSSVKVVWNPVFKNFQGLRMHTSTPAYDSAINSGNFSLLSSALQTKIGYVYLRIQNCQQYNDEMWKFYRQIDRSEEFNLNNTTMANELTSKFNDHMDHLKQEIVETLSELENEVKPL